MKAITVDWYLADEGIIAAARHIEGWRGDIATFNLQAGWFVSQTWN